MAKGRKKPSSVPVPQPEPEEAESSGSDEEEEDQQIEQDEFLHNAQKSDSEDDEGSSGDDDDDDDSEYEEESGKKDHNEGSSNSSSGSEGTPSDRFVVIPRKPEEQMKNQKTPKKVAISETTGSKRTRSVENEEAASSKKAKKDAKLEQQTPKQKPNNSEKTNQETSSKDKKSAKKSVSSLPENGSSKKSAKQEKSAADKRIAKIQESESKKTMSPSKPKLWTPKEEVILSTELLKEMGHLSELPESKSDAFWSDMAHRLEDQCTRTWTEDQICEKMKRMRTRYTGMAAKIGNTNFKFRTKYDKELYNLWDQIWGKQQSKPASAPSSTKDDKSQHPSTANATPANGKASKPDESESDESDDSDDSESDESDDEAESEENTAPIEEAKKKINMANERTPITPVPLCSFADTKKIIQGEIKTSISEMQQASKEMLVDWQEKTLDLVKAGLGHGRPICGMWNSNMPISMDIQVPPGENAFQQQWIEIQMQELELYKKKLDLMLKECTWKQEHLKSQMKSSK